jgi:hypothetical protein
MNFYIQKHEFHYTITYMYRVVWGISNMYFMHIKLMYILYEMGNYTKYN